ncbi:MAG: CHRD domain-containing protein [Actinomycetota bacterium]|nr:CHRD domain-containing protein [Actinomycetota bacterium]
MAHNVRQICRDGMAFELAASEIGADESDELVEKGDDIPRKKPADRPNFVTSHFTAAAATNGQPTEIADRLLTLPFNPIDPPRANPRQYHGFYTVEWSQRVAVGTEIFPVADDAPFIPIFPEEKFVVENCFLSPMIDKGLRARLRGHSEIGSANFEFGAGDENGKGRAVVRLRPKARRVCFELRWRNIRRPTAAHIHAGPVGVVGPVLVDLKPKMHRFRHQRGSGQAQGCVRAVMRPLARDVGLHPSGFYVNIHNAPYPDGAIRGNLKR